MKNRPTGYLEANDSRGVLEIRRGAEGYPSRLEKLVDPPDRLFIQGSIPQGPMVAIVGSRNADIASQRFVSRLSGDLVQCGIAVISGGALGIDTASHQGALDASGVTVAVIGSGFNYMYPEANRGLFCKISEHGALLTEFSHEQPPTKWTFPRRNRIVAALSSAVVVAEAGQRSGALITARIARELGVPIGSVPGPAGDPRNRGNNQLLREGAHVVENASDILALMQGMDASQQLNLPNLTPRRPSLPVNLSSTEGKILEILSFKPIHIDEIIVCTGIGSGEINAALVSLEIEGLIEDQGGRNFVRVG
jgi:DNA processing protein